MRGVRENYYVSLALGCIWMLALALIGPHLLGIWTFPLFAISAVVMVATSFTFRCAYCAHPIVRCRMTIGALEMSGYTSFPGKTCTSCGKAVSGD